MKQTKREKHILRDLFLTFMKIGLFTFGGGYAMISVIENDCVERKKWITHDEMMDLTVIAESTPGPIAINCATFVGNCKGGILGAVFATLGMVLPSFVIIYIISILLDNFLDIPAVGSAFKGIKIGVGFLILKAAFNMMKQLHRKALPITIMILSAAAMLLINLFALDFSTIALMLIAGGVSFALFLINGSPDEKGVGK